MLQVFPLISFILAVCSEETSATPTPANQATPEIPAPVLCGQIPPALFHCLSGMPKITPPDGPAQCEKTVFECDRMKCVFSKMEFLKDEKVDTKKMTEFFDKFAHNHSEWATAVDYIKSTCLSAPLLPQGVHLNCEPYDVIMCIRTQFIKHAQPDRWSTKPECTYPRQFAASCPFCPSDCFAPAVPSGSCNACFSLPRQV